MKCFFPVEIPILVYPKQISGVWKVTSKKKKKKKKVLSPFSHNFSSFNFQCSTSSFFYFPSLLPNFPLFSFFLASLFLVGQQKFPRQKSMRGTLHPAPLPVMPLVRGVLCPLVPLLAMPLMQCYGPCKYSVLLSSSTWISQFLRNLLTMSNWTMNMWKLSYLHCILDTSAVVGMFFPYRHVEIIGSQRRHACWHNSSFKVDWNTRRKTVI